LDKKHPLRLDKNSQPSRNLSEHHPEEFHFLVNPDLLFHLTKTDLLGKTSTT
jgi:hypothetical protein